MNFQQIALFYLEKYGFNILPLKDKAPAIDWTKWQKDIMNSPDINSFNWNINGIGAVSGINRLRCLDFDSVTDISIVKKFLRALGLPSEYLWTVRSGSGKGYHIWFYCDEDSYLFRILGGEKSYYNLKPLPLIQVEDPAAKKYNSSGGKEGMGLNSFSSSKDDKPLPASPLEKGRGAAECDHIELRWENCQTVLPPSFHPSGNQYEFLFTKSIPGYAPYNVPVGRLIDTLESLCALNKEDSPAAPNNAKKENKKSTAVNFSYVASASEYLQGRVNNYDDWMRIGFALASLGEKGRTFFLIISMNNPTYPEETEGSLNRKFDGYLKDYRGDITIASLYEIAKKYGYEKPECFFWGVADNKARIYTNLMIEFLEKSGFSKMFFDKDFIFIKDTANVIAEVPKVSIKDFLISFIKDSAHGIERNIVLEGFMSKVTQYCNDGTLECIHTVVPDFIKDTKSNVHFYFTNCYMEVTKDDIKQRDYADVNGKIWEKQKKEHEFYFTDEVSEFQLLINNICRHDDSRINSMRSAIGYLLSSYKDPSCSKAVIFIDEKLSDGAHGRTGKSLVAKGISKMRNALQIDGKNFSFDNKFLFQSVNPDTQLIFFDDVKKRFSFEKLFSVITEGMTVEKKNLNEMRMPFERSPKILITTNHSIEGTDDSSRDRQFVIEFSDHYNANYKPRDEFGHEFFDEWTREQWAAFYVYMADCCRYYLQNGLVAYEHVNLTKKKLIDATSAEFEEFITACLLNQEYNKKNLYNQFKVEYEDFAGMRQNTFSRWIRIYSELYGLEIGERRSGLDNFFWFTKS